MNVLLLAVLFLAGSASADIYKWTDAEGRTHYGAAPKSGQAADRLNIDTSTIGSAGIGPAAAKPDRVLMYATSWCGYCRKARTYFRDKHIDYVEYDIETDKAAKRRYDALGGKGVPVILVGRKRMNGFDEEGFEAIYR